MKGFGHQLRKSDESPGLLHLTEATLQLSVDEIALVIDFLRKVQNQMIEEGPKFDHEHFSDYCGAMGHEDPDCDLIIVRNPVPL